MTFQDAEKKLDTIMYPAKTSMVKGDVDRQALSLAYEALKIVDGISKRFKEYPKEIQDAFLDFRIRQCQERSDRKDDYAYRFVTETMDAIELLQDAEAEYEMPY